MLFFLAVTAGCGSPESAPPVPDNSTSSGEEGSQSQIQLSSEAFANNAKIDERHTVNGDDVSPALSWSGAPAETVSFALICDDPDAPSPDAPADDPWVHWVIYNIPADATSLPAGLPKELELSTVSGALQGVNSWPLENVGYRGPAPPPGSGQHRYIFRLYALDATLQLEAGASKEELLAAMQGHTLAEGKLIGVFERP
jgi:hypothetical protein